MAKYVVIYEDMREDAVAQDLVPDLLKGHVEHIRDLDSRGILFMCGPLKDPFIVHKCYASYRIYEWVEANESNNYLLNG
jgi:uncharacterized protein YciI